MTDAGGGAPSQDSKLWAAAAHLIPLIGLGFIAPLVIWLVKRDEDPFVGEHAKEALNWQITVILGIIISIVLILVIIGFILLVVIGIAAFVLAIVAGVKAANGEPYRYPFAIRLVQ